MAVKISNYGSPSLEPCESPLTILRGDRGSTVGCSKLDQQCGCTKRHYKFASTSTCQDESKRGNSSREGHTDTYDGYSSLRSTIGNTANFKKLIIRGVQCRSSTTKRTVLTPPDDADLLQMICGWGRNAGWDVEDYEYIWPPGPLRMLGGIEAQQARLLRKRWTTKDEIRYCVKSVNKEFKVEKETRRRDRQREREGHFPVSKKIRMLADRLGTGPNIPYLGSCNQETHCQVKQTYLPIECKKRRRRRAKTRQEKKTAIRARKARLQFQSEGVVGTAVPTGPIQEFRHDPIPSWSGMMGVLQLLWRWSHAHSSLKGTVTRLKQCLRSNLGGSHGVVAGEEQPVAQAVYTNIENATPLHTTQSLRFGGGVFDPGQETIFTCPNGTMVDRWQANEAIVASVQRLRADLENRPFIEVLYSQLTHLEKFHRPRNIEAVNGYLDLPWGVPTRTLQSLFQESGMLDSAFIDAMLGKAITVPGNRDPAPEVKLVDSFFYSTWIRSADPERLAKRLLQDRSKRGSWIFIIHAATSREEIRRGRANHFLTVEINWEHEELRLRDSIRNEYRNFHKELKSDFLQIIRQMGAMGDWQFRRIRCQEQQGLDCAIHAVSHGLKRIRPDLGWDSVNWAGSRHTFAVILLAISKIQVQLCTRMGTRGGTAHQSCLGGVEGATESVHIADHTDDSESDESNCASDIDMEVEAREEESLWQAKGLEIISANIGPRGCYGALDELKAITIRNPAVVMLQDLRLRDFNSVRKRQRTAERYLKRHTGYVPFLHLAFRHTAEHPGGVGVLLHPRLALRSNRIDISEVMKDAEAGFQSALLGRVIAIRTLALDCDEASLWVSCYAPVAGSVHQLKFYQAMEELVRRLEVGKYVQVVIGGDWNATMQDQQRQGYRTVIHGDKHFRKFVTAIPLKYMHNRAPTFHSVAHQCSATLDHFFVLDPAGSRIFSKPFEDPSLDHCRLTCELGIQFGRELPRPSLTRRTQQINMREWATCSKPYQKALEQFQMLGETTPVDTALNHLNTFFYDTAVDICGFTRSVIKIPYRNRTQRKILRNMALYRSAIRDAERLADLLAQPEDLQLTVSIKIVWRRADPPILSSYKEDFVQNYNRRLLDMRRVFQRLSQQFTKITNHQKTLNVRAYAEECRQRLREPSSGEIQRLLHKAKDQAPLYAIESKVPDTIVYKEGLYEEQIWGTSGRVGPLKPVELLQFMQSLPANTEVEVMRRGNRIVTESEDILAAFEHHYAEQATSTRWCCRTCNSSSFLHIPVGNKDNRDMATLCLACRTIEEGPACERPITVGATAGISSVVMNQRLSEPFTIEDLDRKINELTNRKATLPNSIRNEWLKVSPPNLRLYILSLLNRALAEGQGNAWKHSLVRLLPKQGDTVQIEGYRPICLLDTLHKLYTSLLEDRMRSIAERYDLFGTTQEGFRAARTCARQTQVLKYLIDKIRLAEGTALVALFDFKGAFDSPDHSAIMDWLEKMGFDPADVKVLRELYRETYLQVATTVGTTSKIWKTRGTAQGDPLSPCLFGIVIGVLLKRLVAHGIGISVSESTKVGGLLFADDLVTITQTLGKQQQVLDIIHEFEKESGMRLNPHKCIFTGHDFRRGRNVSMSMLKYDGISVPRSSQLRSDQPFRHLGCRMALDPRFGPRAQRDHIIDQANRLGKILQGHVYLPEQAQAVAKMVLHGAFLFSSATAGWHSPSIERLAKAWTSVHKTALKISRGTATSLLQWSVQSGGLALPHPTTLLLQGLTIQVESLVRHDDHVRYLAREELNQLINRCGTAKLDMIGRQLVLENARGVCQGPIEQLLWLTSRLGETVRLPLALSLQDNKLSWIEIFTTVYDTDRQSELYPIYRIRVSRMLDASIRPENCDSSFVRNLFQSICPLSDESTAKLTRLLDAGTSVTRQGFLQTSIHNFFIPVDPSHSPPAPAAPSERTLVSELVRVVQPYYNGRLADARSLTFAEATIYQFTRRKKRILEWVRKLPQVALRAIPSIWNDGITEAEFKQCVSVLLNHHRTNMTGSNNYSNQMNLFFAFNRPAPVRKNEYVPEAVRAIATIDGREMMRVKWLGWPETTNTWEPTSNIRNQGLKSMLTDFRNGRWWPNIPVTVTNKSVTSKPWTDPIRIQDFGTLPSLVRVHEKPQPPASPCAEGYQITTLNDVATVSRNTESTGSATSFEGNDFVFRMDQARFFFLLERWSQTGSALEKVIGAVKHLQANEHRNPAYSQQFQEILTRDTGITHVCGQSFITMWAGLTLIEPGQFADNPQPVLWLADQISEAEMSNLQQSNVDWILVVRQAKVRGFNIPGFLWGKLTKMNMYAQRNAWSTGKTLSKNSRVVVSIFTSRTNLLDTQLHARLKAELAPHGKVHLRNLQLWSTELIHTDVGIAYQQMRNGEILAATDGSYQSGKAGAGALWYDPQQGTVVRLSQSVQGVQKVFRAELLGLILLLERVPEDKTLWVLVDCLALLQAIRRRCSSLRRGNLTTGDDADLLQRIDSLLLRRTAETHLVKVRAHGRDPFNEAVDDLAKEGTLADREEEPPARENAVLFQQDGEMVPFARRRTILHDKVTIELEQRIKSRKMDSHKRKLTRMGKRELDQWFSSELAQHVQPELNITERFLARPDEAREYLGDFLKGSFTKEKRWMVQSLSHTFPTRSNLFRWKYSKSDQCHCRKGAETMSHIQCRCPFTGSARIAAHHRAWRKLSRAIELGNMDLVLFTERTIGNTIHGCHFAEEPAVREWNAAVESIQSNIGQDLDPWAAPEITGEQSMLDVDRRRLLRQRPDGIFIDFNNRRVYVSDFTRANDLHEGYQQRSDQYKITKYTPLAILIQETLGDEWLVGIYSFTAGVHGSIPKSIWSEHLRQMGVPMDKHEPIFEAVAKSVIASHAKLIAARIAETTSVLRPVISNAGSDRTGGGLVRSTGSTLQAREPFPMEFRAILDGTTLLKCLARCANRRATESLNHANGWMRAARANQSLGSKTAPTSAITQVNIFGRARRASPISSTNADSESPGRPAEAGKRTQIESALMGRMDDFRKWDLDRVWSETYSGRREVLGGEYGVGCPGRSPSFRMDRKPLLQMPHSEPAAWFSGMMHTAGQESGNLLALDSSAWSITVISERWRRGPLVWVSLGAPRALGHGAPQGLSGRPTELGTDRIWPGRGHLGGGGGSFPQVLGHSRLVEGPNYGSQPTGHYINILSYRKEEVPIISCVAQASIGDQRTQVARSAQTVEQRKFKIPCHDRRPALRGATSQGPEGKATNREESAQKWSLQVKSIIFSVVKTRHLGRSGSGLVQEWESLPLLIKTSRRYLNLDSSCPHTQRVRTSSCEDTAKAEITLASRGRKIYRIYHKWRCKFCADNIENPEAATTRRTNFISPRISRVNRMQASRQKRQNI